MLCVQSSSAGRCRTDQSGRQLAAYPPGRFCSARTGRIHCDRKNGLGTPVGASYPLIRGVACEAAVNTQSWKFFPAQLVGSCGQKMLHPGCNILLSQVAALAVDLRSWKFFPTQPVGSSLQKMLHPGCKMSPNQVLASAIRLDLQSWKFFPTQPVGSSLQKMLHPGCNIFLLVIRHFSTPEEALDAAAFCYLG